MLSSIPLGFPASGPALYGQQANPMTPTPSYPPLLSLPINPPPPSSDPNRAPSAPSLLGSPPQIEDKGEGSTGIEPAPPGTTSLPLPNSSPLTKRKRTSSQTSTEATTAEGVKRQALPPVSTSVPLMAQVPNYGSAVYSHSSPGALSQQQGYLSWLGGQQLAYLQQQQQQQAQAAASQAAAAAQASLQGQGMDPLLFSYLYPAFPGMQPHRY